MFNMFKGSPAKALIQLNKKKYSDISACDVCIQKKKWCRLLCKYRNTKYKTIAAKTVKKKVKAWKQQP